MTKPEMRDELDRLISITTDVLNRLRVLRVEMHNRSPEHRAPPISKPISPQMRRSIRAMRKTFPNMTLSEIARAHGLNSEGRISEILRGKRV